MYVFVLRLQMRHQIKPQLGKSIVRAPISPWLSSCISSTTQKRREVPLGTLASSLFFELCIRESGCSHHGVG